MDDRPAIATQMPNLTGVPLAELFAADDDSALAHAARKLAQRVEIPEDALAAFTSYVE